MMGVLVRYGQMQQAHPCVCIGCVDKNTMLPGAGTATLTAATLLIEPAFFAGAPVFGSAGNGGSSGRNTFSDSSVALVVNTSLVRKRGLSLDILAVSCLDLCMHLTCAVLRCRPSPVHALNLCSAALQALPIYYVSRNCSALEPTDLNILQQLSCGLQAAIGLPLVCVTALPKWSVRGCRRP